ncbi:hypothetical protein [Lutispora sp.]
MSTVIREVFRCYQFEEHQKSIQERVACLRSKRAKHADIDEDE